MHLHNLRSLRFALPCVIGIGVWMAPAQANPAGINYNPTFPLPGQVIDGSTVTYGNSGSDVISTGSGYYSPPYVYAGPQTYYPPVPYYPSYYPPHYPNLQIFSVQSYTRPSPEIVVDPQYGVRFKNPPGY